MSDPNPYQAPSSSFSPPVQASSGDGSVPPGIMAAIAATKPWVTFLAILGFVGAGLMVLGGFGVVVAGSMMTRSSSLGAGMGILYVVLGGLYFFPSFFLLRFGGAMRQVLEGGGMNALTEAMVRQKSFWRLVGISTLVLMCIYFLAILVGIVVGVMSAASR